MSSIGDFNLSRCVSWFLTLFHSREFRLYLLAFAVLFFLFPTIGYCSVESTLSGIQGKLITTILPLVAILGILFAALSFAAGSPNARSHMVLAIIGAVVGFGAPSIIAFVRGVVQ